MADGARGPSEKARDSMAECDRARGSLHALDGESSARCLRRRDQEAGETGGVRVSAPVSSATRAT